MKTEMGFRLRSYFAVSAIVVGMCLGSTTYSQTAADGNKIILDPQSVRANDPVKLVGFRLGDQQIQPGVPFQSQDKDWLKNMTFVVRNVMQNKEVVGIWASYFFPDTWDGKAYVGMQIHLGARPAQARFNAAGEPLMGKEDAAIDVLPNQTIAVPLGQYFDGVKTTLTQHHQLDKYSNVQLSITTVYFSDGTKWSPGYFAKPDPANPGKYVRILPSEFYGYHPRTSAQY